VTRLCTVLLALALAGCGGAAVTTGASPASSTRGEGAIRHVVRILMENKSTDVVDSPGAPYLSHLARTYGYATDYRAVAHPSLPNYIALTSGATHGVTQDWSPGALPGEPMTYSLDVPSIFSQLPGGRSRSLAESMPFGPTPDLTAAFTFVAPNAIDDMHNGTIQEGNRFLATYIPKLLATPQYQSGTTVIFITWDESESHTGVNDVPLIVISPYTHGVVDHHLYSHYSLLRTTEQLLGLPLLGNARAAPSLLGRFGF
jgi:hypothetical protein